MKLAYIASPIAYFYVGRPANSAKNVAKRVARELAKSAKRRGYAPISAPLALLDVYNEQEEREQAFEVALQILKKCDVFFYNKDDLPKSEGMKKELEIAKELGLEIIEY